MGGDLKSSPSLDRIVPDFGYVEGNVAFICGRANTLKLNRTPDVLRRIADYVEDQISRERNTSRIFIRRYPRFGPETSSVSDGN